MKFFQWFSLTCLWNLTFYRPFKQSAEDLQDDADVASTKNENSLEDSVPDLEHVESSTATNTVRLESFSDAVPIIENVECDRGEAKLEEKDLDTTSKEKIEVLEEIPVIKPLDSIFSSNEGETVSSNPAPFLISGSLEGEAKIYFLGPE